MLNVIAAVGCAFLAGAYLSAGLMFGFWMNVVFVLVNLPFVWHHYSKHKE